MKDDTLPLNRRDNDDFFRYKKEKTITYKFQSPSPSAAFPFSFCLLPSCSSALLLLMYICTLEETGGGSITLSVTDTKFSVCSPKLRCACAHLTADVSAEVFYVLTIWRCQNIHTSQTIIKIQVSVKQNKTIESLKFCPHV